MLLWFVEPAVAEAALSRKVLVEESQIEIIPEKITPSVLHENVHLESCKKYLTNDAWLALQGVIDVISSNPSYYCGTCTNGIDDKYHSSIQCDSCLTWFHYKCANIKKTPKTKLSFCRNC